MLTYIRLAPVCQAGAAIRVATRFQTITTRSHELIGLHLNDLRSLFGWAAAPQLRPKLKPLSQLLARGPSPPHGAMMVGVLAETQRVEMEADGVGVAAEATAVAVPMEGTESRQQEASDSEDELPLAQRSQPREAGEAVLSDPALLRATVQVLRPYLSRGGVPAGQGSQGEEGTEQQGGPAQERARALQEEVGVRGDPNRRCTCMQRGILFDSQRQASGLNCDHRWLTSRPCSQHLLCLQHLQKRLELVNLQAAVQAELTALLDGTAEVPALPLPAEMLDFVKGEGARGDGGQR